MLKRAVLVFFLLIFLIVLNAFLNPYPKKEVVSGFKPSYGVSYSFEQAGWYGLDGRKSYVDLLDMAKFTWVRLPFFWNQMIDPATGDFNNNFDDLKFAIGEAKRRDIKVIVALGLKTPYYPEYHLPESVRSKMNFGDTIGAEYPIANEVLAIDKKVVEELAQYDNIAFWQIENEPFLANVNNWKIDESLLSEEVKVVRGADAKHRPIILNHVGPAVFDKKYRRLFNILQPGDVLGVNAYFKTQGTYLTSFKLGREIHIKWPSWLVWPVQSWTGFSTDFEGLVKETDKKGIKLWVLEMQAEPYVRDLENARKQTFYFSAQDIERANQYLLSSKVESVGLWGASFWQFRQKLGDDSWIKIVKEIVD